MAKKKKSEIDAILEQLKNSYFDDSHDIEDESPEKAYESDEDAELTAVLEKIFSESEDEYKPEDEERAEVEQTLNEAVTVAADAKSEANQATDIEQIEKSNVPEAESTTAEIAEQNDDVKTEQERVDDVLKSMFHFGGVNTAVESEEPEDSEEPAAISCEEACEAEEIEAVEQAEAVVDNVVTEATEPLAEESISVEEASVIEEASTIDEPDAIDEPIVADDPAEVDIVAEEDISTFELVEQEPPRSSLCDIVDGDADNVYIDELIEEAAEPVQKKKKVTSPDEYTDDIMQYSLAGISFYKPQGDVDFSVIEAARQSEDAAESGEAVSGVTESADTKSEISDKEIALLMKLGYSGEINASGENEHAHKVIFDESKTYVPENHNIVHGFSGKEFSSRAQAPAIKKKFKQDKLHLFISAIIVSVLALIAIVTDFIAVFSYVKYDSLSSTCLLCSLGALLVMAKKVYAGVCAIFKFDTNQYSVPSLLLIEGIACNLIMGLILAFSSASMTGGSYYSVGGYAVLYMAIAAWSEWLDCYRESGVFNFIAENKKLYVAEKRTSADFSYNENKRRHASAHEDSDGRYIVKQAKFVSGFHKKMTNNHSGMSRIFITIGIIPAIAIIMGMIIAIVNDSLVSGLSGMSFIFFLSAPLLGVASLSLIELLSYFKLKQSNSAFISSDAFESISNIRSLVFKDKDAIEVVAYTPINPNKNADNPRKWLNIAKRVFETLGGPLSKIEGSDHDGSSNIAHDIAINAISDNGIDVYFDSSMNILIGDKAYMQAHNIKVKTDVNLTGATRGAERTVIYMAFDKVPQIGFIVTSHVKKSFLKIITLLGSNGINIEVKSYEPEVNEYFFELNVPDYPITTVKPTNYENTDASDVSDCELISTNSLDMCRSIVYSKVIASDIRKEKAQRKLQSVIGFISSVALGVLLCLPSNIKLIAILQKYSPVLFYLISIAMVVPSIIHIVKVYKRK